MKERPILFSSPMVKAILAGTKTQTRRVMKPQPQLGEYSATGHEGCPWWAWTIYPDDNRRERAFFWKDGAEPGLSGECPYGQPGDQLWVRETFKQVASGQIKNGYGEVRYSWAYKANSETRWADRPTIIHDLTGQPETGPMQFRELPWKSPIHMPRRASRITLEITQVRCQRLQDISGQDADAEGAPQLACYGPGCPDGPNGCNQRGCFGAREWYGELWNKINGTGSWEANPWVWTITFKRVTP